MDPGRSLEAHPAVRPQAGEHPVVRPQAREHPPSGQAPGWGAPASGALEDRLVLTRWSQCR